jgi:hypothetical protein
MAGPLEALAEHLTRIGNAPADRKVVQPALPDLLVA